MELIRAAERLAGFTFLVFIISGCSVPETERSDNSNTITSEETNLKRKHEVYKFKGLRLGTEVDVCRNRILITSDRKTLPQRLRSGDEIESTLLLSAKDQAKFVHLVMPKDLDKITPEEFYKNVVLEFTGNLGVTVEPDYVIRPPETMDVEPAAALDPDWWKTQIRLNQVVNSNGFQIRRNVVVAVLDTGIDYTIDPFNNNLWKAPAGGFPSTLQPTCPENTVGVNFTGGDACDPMDRNGHGTKVAGVIAANGGIFGNGSQAIKILAVKVMENSGCTSNIIQGLQFIRAINESGISPETVVVNISAGCSLTGGGEVTALITAAREAWQDGLLIVASAGNNRSGGDNLNPNTGHSHYPASIDLNAVLAVAATSGVEDDRLATSNFGNRMIDIAAPGVNVGTVAMGDGTPVVIDQTSAAAPVVSASAAVIQAICPVPAQWRWMIRRCLREGARNNRPRDYVETGRIDLYGSSQRCGCLR